MKKNLIKIFAFLMMVGLLGIFVRYTSQVFAGKADQGTQNTQGTINLSSIINTGCIEFMTSNGIERKCDDVEIYYADQVYPVKKWQKTGGMADFVDYEINVEIGEYISYKVDFVNLGDKSFIGIVKDYLPNCITFITGSIHGDGISNAVFQHSSNNTQVRFKGINLRPGQSGYMLVTGQVSSSESCQSVTRYTNTGSFKSTNPSGTELFDSVVAHRQSTLQELKIDKELLTTGYLSAGESVAYKITVQNMGPGTATGVVIYDALPKQIQYITSSISVPSYSTYGFNTGATTINGVVRTYVQYSNITLAKNGRAIMYLTGRILEGYTFGEDVKNCATASGYNTIQVEDCVSPTPPLSLTSGDVVITKNVNKSYVKQGDTVVYTIKYHNKSDQTLTNYTIKDNWPIELRFISADPRETSSGGNTIIWDNLPALPAHSTGTIILTGEVK